MAVGYSRDNQWPSVRCSSRPMKKSGDGIGLHFQLYVASANDHFHYDRTSALSKHHLQPNSPAEHNLGSIYHSDVVGCSSSIAPLSRSKAVKPSVQCAERTSVDMVENVLQHPKILAELSHRSTFSPTIQCLRNRRLLGGVVLREGDPRAPLTVTKTMATD
jgi:hypothetical protein